MSRTPQQLTDVAALLAAVAALPPVAREVARQRIDAALAGEARACRASLGLLALELAPAVAADRLADVAAVLDLDTGTTTLELAEDAPATARRQLAPPSMATRRVPAAHALTA